MAANVTFGPFNFYQGTGVGDEVRAQFFPGPILFTGFYFGEDLKLGWKEGYTFRLRNDDTVCAPEFSLFASGSIVSGFAPLCVLVNKFSGTCYGYSKDISQFTGKLSGFLTGEKSDIEVFVSRVSGYISGNQVDTVGWSYSLSSSVIEDTLGQNDFEMELSSDVSEGYKELKNWELSFEGQLNGKDKDIASISFALTSLSFEAGAERFNIDEENSAAITFALKSITYNE